MADFRDTYHRLATLAITYRVAAMVGIIGLFFSWWAYHSMQERMDEENLQSFRWEVQNRRSAMENSLRAQQSILQELQGFYAASKFVDRDEFKQFTRHIFDRFPLGVELAWVPRIEGEQRPDFEQTTQKEWPGFEINARTKTGQTVRATQQKRHFPIHYMEPRPDLLGFDLASNPMLRETLDQARDTGHQTASPIFILPGSHPDTNKNRFMVVMPIYRNGLPTETLEQRRTHLHGFYVTILSVHALFEKSLDSMHPEGIHFWLHETETKNSMPFFVHISRFSYDQKDLPMLDMGMPEPENTRLHVRETMTVLNQRWLFTAKLAQDPKEYHPNIHPEYGHAMQPLAVGLLSTLLLSGFMVWLRQQAIKRQQMTDQLIQANGYTDGILRSMADALMVISPRGRVSSANQAACTLLGLEMDALTNLRAGHIFDEETSAMLVDFGLENMHTPTHQAHRLETTLTHSQGTTIPVLLSIAVLLDAQHHFFGMVCVARDMTEQKLVAAKIHHALMTAQAASSAKSEFIANMSHELRTPMNAITGFSHLAFQSKDPKKTLDYIKKIKTSSQTLMALISDVLDFSTMDANRMALEMVTFNMFDLFDRLEKLFQKQAAQKGIELLFAPPQACDDLYGDSLRLEQVLINLIRNAIKFTETGSIVVGVRPTKRAHGGIQLDFFVRDTGIGIAPDAIEPLFEPFVQADGSATRKYGGTGLGLAICKQLVGLMGGRIWAESALGEGSTFHFDIMLAHRQKETKELVIPAHLQGMNILVVDDNPLAREITTKLLQDLGFAVTPVDSGQAALAERMTASDANNPYPLMFVDWQMPEMDGIDIIRQVRAQDSADKTDGTSPDPQEIKIILLTSFEGDTLPQRAKAAGANLLIHKPANHAKLWHAILTIWEEPTNGAHPTHGTSAEEEARAKIHGARVLVVEDNDISLQATQELLWKANVVVETAKNGLEALRRLDEITCDAVLMDLHMPEMDGISTTLCLRQESRFQHVPIIALTSHTTPEVRENCREAGMNAHLDKPVRAETLYTTLAQWIGPTHPPATTDGETEVEEVEEVEKKTLGTSPDTDQKVSIDPTQTTPLLTELATLLRANNLETEAIMATLEAQLHASHANAAFQTLKAEMDAYDFDAALQSVIKIATLLEISLEENSS